MSARPGVSKTKSIAAIKALQQNIGHEFSDVTLLTTALTHVSALKSNSARAGSYQRLEFLGDRVLGLAVSAMLFAAFPDSDEGELSRRLAELVRKETCADVARIMGVFEAIKLGSVGGGASERLRNSVLGDVCEAVIGAVFIDAGYQTAAAMIERLWSERMHKPCDRCVIRKRSCRNGRRDEAFRAPVYREVERTGPDHNPSFRIAVDLRGLDAAEGVGPSKQAAEKAAASAMLAREGVAGFANDV